MSDIIVFKKDGIHLLKNGEEQNITNIISYLRMTCEIEKGVTLLEFFRSIAKYPELMDFIACYSWCYHIKEFHHQAEELKKDDEPLDELIISWHINFGKRKKHKWFDISPDFHGIRHGITYSISYSPMWELAPVPLRVDNTVKIYESNKLIIESERDFSLLDVLDAVYYDISFMGGPEDNAAFLKELIKREKEIKDGTAELIPFDIEKFEQDNDE